jgi:hypothetical protein
VARLRGRSCRGHSSRRYQPSGFLVRPQPPASRPSSKASVEDLLSPDLPRAGTSRTARDHTCRVQQVRLAGCVFARRADRLSHGADYPMPNLLDHLAAPSCSRLGSNWDRCEVARSVRCSRFPARGSASMSAHHSSHPQEPTSRTSVMGASSRLRARWYTGRILEGAKPATCRSCCITSLHHRDHQVRNVRSGRIEQDEIWRGRCYPPLHGRCVHN